jgi:hypothetical protein
MRVGTKGRHAVVERCEFWFDLFLVLRLGLLGLPFPLDGLGIGFVALIVTTGLGVGNNRRQ